ncbi:MAG TPA: 4-hydroxythreonine-4-phosphate dehydrogenase PdxA [Dongiaceae bacterium]|nr:4-hydroxythreonine-4-phosphate dehydrogenase PdxA [Dongiaceae bacterium]
MKGLIGISLGDVSGIGPEVTLKMLAEEAVAPDSTRYLIIGDIARLRQLNQYLGLYLPLKDYTPDLGTDRFFVVNPLKEALPPGLPAGAPATAHAAMAWLQDGAQRCLRGEIDALVTAPVNKEAIIRAGYTSFVGQTELLSEIAGTQRTAMMLLGHDDRGRWLRVALATIHVPLRQVADHLRAEAITQVIELAAQACRDLRLSRARIGVCGLNPHAGEGGKIGDEEIKIITPAIQAAQRLKIDAHGPVPADALFYQVYHHGEYDAVVAMYHDQGLAPLKMIGFENGVNWTLGLPFVRTSPDHGTAYDIAGKGLANPSSMVSAVRLARQLTQ